MKKILAVALLMAGSSPAFAEGLYLGGYLGPSALDEADLDWGGTPGTMQFDLGFGAGVIIGASVADNIRLEGDLSYIVSPATQIGSTTVDGNVNTLSLGANLFYDFGGNQFRPYVGAGLAVVNIDVGGVTFGGADVFEGAVTTMGGQIILGVSIPLQTVTVFADYRGFMTPALDLKTAGGATAVSMDYFRNSLQFGIRVPF